MKVIGIVATTATAALVVGALVVGARSMPDIKRYLKMRSM